jgi:hypothetical protein
MSFSERSNLGGCSMRFIAAAPTPTGQSPFTDRTSRRLKGFGRRALSVSVGGGNLRDEPHGTRRIHLRSSSILGFLNCTLRVRG